MSTRKGVFSSKKGGYTLIDYEFKSVVIKSGLPQLEKRLSKEQYIKQDYCYSDYSIYMADIGRGKEWKEAHRINNANNLRVRRLRNRINDFLSNGHDNLFLTLTFNDDTLSNTTPEQRRKLVVRYLKSFNAQYVANIDYGAKNDREHYHALINTSKVDYSVWHKNGAIKGEIVKIEGSTAICISKYISKLTNHAIKMTTKRQAIIYSR